MSSDEAQAPQKPKSRLESQPKSQPKSQPNEARVIPLRPPGKEAEQQRREPLWRDLVGDVLRRERLAQERTLKDVADAARISMPYLSELERGRKEASSEVLAAAARALGLGLPDLLSLAQHRLAGPPHARPARASYQGDVRLAA